MILRLAQQQCVLNRAPAFVPRIWFFLVSLVFLFPSHSLAGSGDPDWLFASPRERQLVERAEALTNLSEYDEALSVTRAALALFPDAIETNLQRIGLASKMRQISEIIPEYLERARRNPSDTSARFLLAYCYDVSKYRYSRSDDRPTSEIEAILAVSPRMPRARWLQLQLAQEDWWRLFEDHSKRGEVTRMAEQFARDFPDWGTAVLAPASLTHPLRSTRTRVQAAYQQAIRLPSVPAQAYVLQEENAHGLWYDYRDSLPLLDKALAIDPSRVDVAISKANCLCNTGQGLEALQLLERLVRTVPRSGDARVALSSRLGDYHRWNEATQVLKDGVGLVQYDQYYAQRVVMAEAQALIMTNRADEAMKVVQDFIKLHPSEQDWSSVRHIQSALATRGTHDRVRVIDGIPYYGKWSFHCASYCLSMAMQYWGRQRTPEEIADKIFGVAGTVPQALQEYAQAQGFESVLFQGSVATWKRLIDAGVPVLRLKMLSSRSGVAHYILLSGYDDIRREFLVHDPLSADEGRVAYTDTEDDWSFSTMRSSVIIFPKGYQAPSLTKGLNAPPGMKALDNAFYFMTGAALFRHAWRGLLFHAGAALLTGCLLLLLLRRTVYPLTRSTEVAFVCIVFGTVTLLCVLIGFARMKLPIVLLLGFYLGSASALLLFAGQFVWRLFSGAWVRPWTAFFAMVFCVAAWASLGLILLGDEWWRYRMPLFVGGGAIVLMAVPVFLLRRSVRRARLGPVTDPVEFIRTRNLLQGKGTYCLDLAFTEALMRMNRWADAGLFINEMRQSRPYWQRRFADYHVLVDTACVLLDPDGFRDTQRRVAETQLRELVSRWKAGTAIGACARELLAQCVEQSDPARARELKTDTEAAARKWRSWPRFPGTPRFGFFPRPHLLLEMCCGRFLPGPQAPVTCSAADEAQV